MKFALLFSFLVLPFASLAQPGIAKSFFQLSRPEKGWVITHPLKAKRAFMSTAHARQITDSLFRLHIPDTFRHGGLIDAFRHSYWMAILTHTIGERASRKLGRCHEKGNKIDYRRGRSEDGFLQDATACEMDLHNNDVGIHLAMANYGSSREDMVSICLGVIKSGQMKILSINSSGEYCDCEGKPVAMVRLGMDKWKLPICLLPSR